MAKSNQRAVRMRKNNRAFHIADRKEREARREFNRPPIRAAKVQQMATTLLLMGWYKKAVSLFSYINPWKWFQSIGSSTAIAKLDLTDKSGRSDGARWLRGVFGQQLKMRSTRDGKPV